uniref:CUB domain-containing protein n=1 Tax=Panagrolaimus davidi TaxID=227884 RepID=A0A914PMF1_9BILA
MIVEMEIKMLLAYYQFPPNNGFPNVFLLSDDTSYLVRNDFPISNSIAEQGFVTFMDHFEGCPMEFLSKDKPFLILQENQILHIRSNFDNYQIREVPCQWRFVSPNGYGFKIVIQKFNISKTTSFRIENSTQIIANEKSAKTYHPYYNSDNYIQITLSKGEANFITDMEFQAYISLIKNSQEKTNISCNVLFKNNTIIWSNINETKGYENNIQCFYELILPANAVVIVSMTGYLENKIDYVKYHEIGSYDESSKIIEIPDYQNEIDFVIDNFKDNFDKHFMFEFVSDGSVQFSGFNIVFEFVNCKCNEKVAECSTYENRLMEYPPSLDEYYYCGNLKCNITV